MSKLFALVNKYFLAALLLVSLSYSRITLAETEEVKNEHEAPAPASAAIPSGSCPKTSACPIAPLTSLMAGNQRFAEGRMAHPLEDAKRRKELTSGQAPQAIILSCSDSRVPPELIFDQGLGEVFVVRTAGEVADQIALASIEYAIEHLGARLLMVLGHDSCGAVKATLAAGKSESTGSDNLDRLLGMIKPNLAAVSASDDKLMTEAVKANVEGVAKSLITKSKIIKEKLDEKELLIVKGVYHLESGKVDIWF